MSDSNSEFESQLKKLCDESDDLQKTEMELKTKTQLFHEKLGGFLKEQGLPDNFTIPQLALFAIRKSRV